jgi:hypothetical protein
MWDIPTVVTAKFDDRKRVLIPQGKPGQVVAIIENGDGTITLSPVKVKKGRRSILNGIKPLTKAECDQCWGGGSDREHDAFVTHCAGLPAGSPPQE